MIVINARLWNCYNCKASLWGSWWRLLPASVCVCVFLMTDSARGLGQSQGGSHLHRDRPPPVHHPELQHHRRHVQGHRDREGNPRPAHGPEWSLLQAGHHGSANQLNAVETEEAGGSWDGRMVREVTTVTTISIQRHQVCLRLHPAGFWSKQSLKSAQVIHVMVLLTVLLRIVCLKIYINQYILAFKKWRHLIKRLIPQNNNYVLILRTFTPQTCSV